MAQNKGRASVAAALRRAAYAIGVAFIAIGDSKVDRGLLAGGEVTAAEMLLQADLLKQRAINKFLEDAEEAAR